QITYGPFDPLLSDKDQFPSLYQMATSDSTVVHGMISLLLHFGWTWVALFVSDDMKGEQFLRYFEAEMVKKGLCVAFTQKLPATKRLYASTDITFMTGISLSSANVHILYGEVRSLINVDFAGGYFLTVGKVWIMVRVLHSFHGGFSFSPHKGEIPGLKHFLKTVDPSHYPEDFYFTKLWFHIFTCLPSGSLCGEIGDCPPNTSLEFSPGDINIMTLSDSSYFIYNAVYAVAHALHKMFLEKNTTQSCTQASHSHKHSLHPLLKKIQFRNSAGSDISFHETRHDVVQYDIQNIVNFPVGLGLMVNIGKFFSKSSRDPALVINEEMIEWPIAFKETPQSVCSQSCGPGFRKVPQEGRPVCCYTCTFCTETFPIRQHRDTPIIKANKRTLSYILLIALLLCFLCSLLFLGRPNTATCLLQQIAFGLVFTVAVSTVLAKTITVILAFKFTKPGRTIRQLLVSGASNSLIPICFLIQLAVCGIWLGISPPFTELDAHSEHGHIILVCNKGSVTAFYCVLGYLGSLALASFTLAFLARNLPDTFNEAKFLTFSMLVFCSVWVTFLPVYHSTKGKVMVAVEVFSILASSAGLLGCIFLPKCYIILIRPEKNSLKDLKKRASSKGF
uniref:G-protein coupled receptors family 3 profile domain-containing protein n=1 Tax=Oryctolagus cuniculus TaxID=9986 RepID=G1TGS2_RABIT